MEEMLEDLFQVSQREEFEYCILKASVCDSLARETLEWIIKCIIWGKQNW